MISARSPAEAGQRPLIGRLGFRSCARLRTSSTWPSVARRWTCRRRRSPGPSGRPAGRRRGGRGSISAPSAGGERLWGLGALDTLRTPVLGLTDPKTRYCSTTRRIFPRNPSVGNSFRLSYTYLPPALVTARSRGEGALRTLARRLRAAGRITPSNCDRLIGTVPIRDSRRAVFGKPLGGCPTLPIPRRVAPADQPTQERDGAPPTPALAASPGRSDRWNHPRTG